VPSLLVEHGSIGLQVVLDSLAGFGVAALECDHSRRELGAEQGRFPDLPREHDLRSGYAGNAIAGEALEHLITHVAVSQAAVESFLARIRAVAAVEVAGGARRLGDDVKAPNCATPQPARYGVPVQLDGCVVKPALIRF